MGLRIPKLYLKERQINYEHHDLLHSCLVFLYFQRNQVYLSSDLIVQLGLVLSLRIECLLRGSRELPYCCYDVSFKKYNK